ncbi:hydrolase [Seiridium cupressi]
MTDKPVARGYVAALLDRLVAWQAGLPAESSSYTFQTVKIPLQGEDYVELEADLYLPKTANNQNAAGTLLVQCPYGRSIPMSIFSGSVYAARGYNVLYVSSRGTCGSGGKFDPARMDAADGVRVVAWMRKQPWYTGTFATLGGSYLGYTQWSLLGSDQPPADMVAAVIQVGPHDFSHIFWGTGSFWLGSLDWAHMTGIQDSMSTLQKLWFMYSMKSDGQIDVKRSVPLADGAKALLGDTSPWFHEWLTRPDIEKDEFYKPMKQDEALETTKVPILLVAGSYDIFLDQTIKQYQRLSQRGCTVALTIAPTCHTETQSVSGIANEAFDWFEKSLGKRGKEKIRPAPVRVNVTGVNEWRWMPIWPPATKPLELFFDSAGQLGKSAPQLSDQSEFIFDPHDPTPSVGGPFLFGGGRVDDTSLSRRRDVLTFTTTPLDRDLEILGRPRIELLHGSDNPHVDLFVRLSEIDIKGVSHNISQAYRRLDPGRASPGSAVKIELELSDCAHLFKKGTAVRIYVAGACFPQYAYNLGSGEDQATGTTLKPAKHMIHFGGSDQSKVILPVSLEQ